MPEPWKVIESAEKALKVGGFLVAYQPSTTQVSELCNSLAENKKFMLVKVLEVIEREWKFEGNIARPEHHMLGHTAFLVFVRRVA